MISYRPRFGLLLAALLPASLPAAELIGTVSGEQPLAVLRLDDGGESLLAVGESIEGCTLQAVRDDRAHFDCAGEGSELLLSRGESLAPSEISPTPQAQRGQLPREVLEGWRRAPQQFVSDVGLRPLARDGEIVAYRIDRLNRDLARSTGLRHGDRVTQVEGFPVSQTAAVVAALRRASELGQLNLGVVRGERRLSLQLSF